MRKIRLLPLVVAAWRWICIPVGFGAWLLPRAVWATGFMGFVVFVTGLTLNGLSGSIQTFATGNSGPDFGIASAGTTHTFNLPDASTTARGVVTTGGQSFSGQKVFGGGIVANVTGIASFATALAANGANCAAGKAPLGVDASGAAEGCYDVQLPFSIAASPVVDATHAVGVGTNANQIQWFDGSFKHALDPLQMGSGVVVGSTSDTCVTFLAKVYYPITVTEATGLVKGGTSARPVLNKCDANGANCAAVTTVATLSADTGTGLSLASAAVPAGDSLQVCNGTVVGPVDTAGVSFSFKTDLQ